MELGIFLAVFLVFMVSWGVTQYGLLFPETEFRIELIRDILILPYWQMYGDLHKDSVLQAPPYDMPEDGACTDDINLYTNYTQLRCSDKRFNGIALIFLAFYLLITNILLFNLLIAIFSSTYGKIEGNFWLYIHLTPLQSLI